MNGLYVGFLAGLNDQPVSAQFTFGILITKTAGYLALCWPWQLVAQRRKRLGLIGGGNVCYGLLYLGEQFFQPFAIRLELAFFAPAAANILIKRGQSLFPLQSGRFQCLLALNDAFLCISQLRAGILNRCLGNLEFLKVFMESF